MSTIDKYRHKIIGTIECPSDHDFVYLSETRTICIYRLEEDIPPDESDFDGRIGDIIIGGGSGEAEALRISHPQAMNFFKGLGKWADIESHNELFKPFWSPTFSYKIGVGFRKIGWDAKTPLEIWLAEVVIDKLLETGTITSHHARELPHDELPPRD